MNDMMWWEMPDSSSCGCGVWWYCVRDGYGYGTGNVMGTTSRTHGDGS